MVIRLAQRVLGNPSLAEDAAQEAILIAMRRLGRLQDPERFRPWFAGIVLNICRQWRSDGWFDDHHSWETLPDSHPRFEPTDWRPGPPDLVEAADLSERVFRAVSDLPPGQRTVILLFYVFGLSYAEIAARLGIDVGAVKTRLHKARRMLRRKLADLWQGEHLGTLVETAREVRQLVDNDSARHEALLVQVVLGGGQWLSVWTANWDAHLATAPVSVRRLPVAIARQLVAASALETA